MSRPIRLKYNTDSTPAVIGLQEMSDTEIDEIADLILDEFSDDATTVGHLAMNTQSSWTSIGTFVDTVRDDPIGTHPSTAISSTNYVFRQKLDSVTTSITAVPMSLHETSGTVDGMEDMPDSEIVSDIINRVQAKLTSAPPGTYKMQPSAPTPGTWVSVATITNSHLDGANSTYLWRRTTGSSTMTEVNRTMYRSSSGNGHIKQMSDAQIKALVDHFRKEIVDNDIGKYQLAASAPTTGTWTQVGSGFEDTRHVLEDVSYSGTYTGSYTGTTTSVAYYTGSSSYGGYRYFAGVGYFAGNRSHAYTGYYAGGYAGSRAHTYTGSYTGTYTGSYHGYYNSNYGSTSVVYYGGVGPYFFQGWFAGYRDHFYTGSYTGYYSGSYTGYYTPGAPTPGYYSGVRPHTYTGFYSNTFTGITESQTYAQYAGAPHTYSQQTFTGSSAYSGNYTGTYVGATIMASLETINNIKLWLRTA